MKYFLYIFTYLLLGASCSSPSRPIDYGTELTATDSICLSIDEHTHYESKSIFQFEENGHEYLSFLNEKASYKVHIYDLDTKQVIKTIHLQKEGRNAMPSTNGCFPLSSKHFLITTWNGVFGIINEKGEVENKNSFWKDSVNFHAFDHICCMSYTYRPAIIKYNPQIQISAESETKRSIFREKDKTKRSKKESAQHSKSRNKSFVMTSVSAL